MSGNRVTKTLLAVAAAFILLGAGNVLVGQLKYSEYSDLLSEASAELTSPETGLSLPLLGTPLNIDKQTQHISRLKARQDFYGVVILGGEFFVALGGIVLLAGLLMFRRADAGIKS